MVEGYHNDDDILYFGRKTAIFREKSSKKGFDFMSNTQYNTLTFLKDKLLLRIYEDRK
jgi:hypothetical protein